MTCVVCDQCKCLQEVCVKTDCDKNYLIMFTATWCPPCRTMKPRIKKLAEDYIVHIIELTDPGNDTREDIEGFGVGSIPTMVIMDKTKELRRFVGITSIETIKKHLRTRKVQEYYLG